MAEGEITTTRVGIITGNDYLKMGAHKESYLIGMMDGIFLAPFFGGERNKMEWFENCLVGTDSNQIVAIVDKYMREHPENWNESMHGIFNRIFGSICPDGPYNK